MGHPSNTLSGGEAQRIKLAYELAKPSRGRTLYFLDEPTTGLHPADIGKLMGVLNALVDAGNTVIVIDNLDIVAEADAVIDLGPEGGAEGGQLVFHGPPEALVRAKGTHTGRFLRQHSISMATESSRKRSTQVRALVHWVFDYYTKLYFSPAHKINKIHALRMV